MTLEQRLEDLDRKLLQAGAIRKARSTPEFAAVVDLWRGHLANLLDVLTQPLDATRTAELRAEIRLLRWMVNAGAMSDDDYARLQQRAQGLRKKAEALHNAGLDGNAEAKARSRQEFRDLINQVQEIR